MKILNMGRQRGKTTRLIQLSNKEWKYIVCADRRRAEYIVKKAEELGLDIPFPITFQELPLRSPHIKGVLMDDLDLLLTYMVGKPIEIATTSCEVITQLRVKPKKSPEVIKYNAIQSERREQEKMLFNLIKELGSKTVHDLNVLQINVITRIPDNRLMYILTKWCKKGIYSYGVNICYGWLTVDEYPF